MVVCDLQPLGWLQQHQAGLHCCVRLSLPDCPLEMWEQTEGEQRVTVRSPGTLLYRWLQSTPSLRLLLYPQAFLSPTAVFVYFFSISLLLLPSFLDT